MQYTDVIIIGGGQAGLAMSHSLRAQGIDHIVLEERKIANAWSDKRWDSLRLLTPNWMTRLPGYHYEGTDPDGYMTAGDVKSLLTNYARSFDAPVMEETGVTRVDSCGADFLVETTRGNWITGAVVIATGANQNPYVPFDQSKVASSIKTIHAADYKRPDQLPSGGTLVVGASASGIQIADELQRAGRKVSLACGRHTLIPRSWRGRDIFSWMELLGILDDRASDFSNIETLRKQPSLQVRGSVTGQNINLQMLSDRGVKVFGRLKSLEGQDARFCNDLQANIADANRRMFRLVSRIEAGIACHNLEDACRPGEVPQAIKVKTSGTALDLEAEGITSVVWATGYTRDYSWLKAPAKDARGELIHEDGITSVPGLYALGLTFMRRRKSSFIDGVGDDARILGFKIKERMEGPSLGPMKTTGEYNENIKFAV